MNLCAWDTEREQLKQDTLWLHQTRGNGGIPRGGSPRGVHTGGAASATPGAKVCQHTIDVSTLRGWPVQKA